MRITNKHPVRQEIANLETYHETLLEAIGQVEDILAKHGLELGTAASFPVEYPGGTVSFPIIPIETAHIVCDRCGMECKEFNNNLVFCWYEMPSGRYEITVYIS